MSTGERKDWFCQDCRVLMIYDDKNDRHICRRCYAELWHNSVDDQIVSDEITTLMKEKYKSNLPHQEPIPAGKAAKGSGGGKSRGKKADLRKKSSGQFGSGLNGKCQSFDA